MKNTVFWQIKTQIVPHRKHYFSATEPIRLMLCQIWILTAVTMNNAVFWYIKPQFLSPRKHITSPLQSPGGQCYVRSEVFTEATMKNAVFWNMKPQFIPHRKHYFSATEHSLLMLGKIWGFHGGDWRIPIFWDIKPQFVPHRRHITSSLQRTAG
jgi:hypothetical protein